MLYKRPCQTSVHPKKIVVKEKSFLFRKLLRRENILIRGERVEEKNAPGVVYL